MHYHHHQAYHSQAQQNTTTVCWILNETELSICKADEYYWIVIVFIYFLLIFIFLQERHADSLIQNQQYQVI